MISPARNKLLAALSDLCDLSPDLRLGQLLAQLGFLGEDQTGRSFWIIDDEQLLAVLHHRRAELGGREHSPDENRLQSNEHVDVDRCSSLEAFDR